VSRFIAETQKLWGVVEKAACLGTFALPEDCIGDAGRHAPLSSMGLGFTEASADASL
jgi:hypothetical protein